MSTISFTTKKLRGPKLGGFSAFPAMRDPIKSTIQARLGDNEGLFINHGMFTDSLPYTMQDQYDTEYTDLEFDAIELENSHLKAVFLPQLGGRLWSLFDKDNKRDLLLDNHELKVGNLAICNAWFAGGAEYNIGRRGHDAQTCSPRFTAVLNDTAGTPVVRFYEFSRDRAIPFQIDFYLPEDSKFLFIRGRIHNIRTDVIPMYFWSNLAVPKLPGERVVVPTDNTYANFYQGGSHFITHIDLPFGEGFDGTYPENYPCVRDHFYNIPDKMRKYEAVYFKDGYGFLFASTPRLQGRKLFVWGECQGGQHWQRRLMADDTPDYIEIQGGICKTQQECMPMPPETVWEWLEAYGAIENDPAKIFGDWDTAVKTTTARVDQILPEEFLEQELERTRTSFATKPGKVVCSGSGWGALEELRRGKKLDAHLDFGTVGEAQKDWVELLKNGTMDASTMPASFMVQEEFAELLKSAKVKNWKIRFHLALWYFRLKDYERCEAELNASIAENANAFNRFALSNLYRVTGRIAEALDLLEDILRQRTGDVSLAKEVLKVFLENDAEPDRILKLYDALDPELQVKPLMIFCRAYAFAHKGELEKAEQLIHGEKDLEIPDIREGENSISDLYVYIQIKKAEREGKHLDPLDIKVPFILDLRMKIK